MLEKIYVAYKGKSKEPFTESDGHPLAYHCLDVAAVAQRLLHLDPCFRARAVEILDLPGEKILPFLIFLMALHDLGKFSFLFQKKLANQNTGEEKFRVRDPGHDIAGRVLFEQSPVFRAWRERQFGAPRPGRGTVPRVPCEDRNFFNLLSAVLAHHGLPRHDGTQEVGRLFSADDEAAALAFVEDVAILLGLETPLGPWLTSLSAQTIPRATWLVAGLCVLCDWLGSNTLWFRHTPPHLSLSEYWLAVALPAADQALAEAGLRPAAPHPAFGLAEALPHESDPQPSPLQTWAQETPLPSEPTLFVLEDLTGSGKTEAALILAARLMQNHRNQGLYFALPTMATANALYQRLAPLFKALFVAEAEPSLVLAHSARDLNPAFRVAPPAAWRPRNPTPADDTAEATCSAWIADDRRRTFLAQVGVGTIDQALLGVLQTRFQALRLFGSAHKVLILDEVHAYDPYMTATTEALLRAHAALGGDAILLSATLPAETRQRFQAAWQGQDPTPVTADPPYPLATTVSTTTHTATPIVAMRGSCRSVPLRFHASPEEAQAHALAMARLGAAVAWIRNTVDDARETWAALRATLPDRPVDLFHARYALGDRLRIETAALAAFGRAATETRAGRILVATQVIEQSLDLDFDVLITDLAPMDLILQRAGRLWRHKRDTRPVSQALDVVMPPPSADADAAWYSRLFPRSAGVYPDHGRLWLTAQALTQAGALHLPEEARALIEGVYGHNSSANMPDALTASHFQEEGAAKAERALARMNTIAFAEGYHPGHGRWEEDLRVSTRLGDPSMAVRLACWDGHTLRPFGEAPTPARAWRLSEITVPLRRLDPEAALTDPALAAAETTVRTTEKWPRWSPPVLPLTPGPANTWVLAVGALSRTRNGAWTYDPVTGLGFGG